MAARISLHSVTHSTLTLSFSSAVCPSSHQPYSSSAPIFPSFIQVGLRYAKRIGPHAMHSTEDVKRATPLPVKGVRFRPCIDIHKGKVKQIVGSTLRDLPQEDTEGRGESRKGEKDEKWGNDLAEAVEPVTNFESEKKASEFAALYRGDGLVGGHVIMLGADDASKAAAFDALRAFQGGFHVGGGINPENAAEFLDAGASHVIVTSYVFRDGRMDSERLSKLVKTVGSHRLVLDLSCRKRGDLYYVVTDRWQRFSDLCLSEQTLSELAESADEFLVHGVDVEGMKLGIDEELVELLGRWSPIPVTYAGGARTLEDLERVKAAGNRRVDITVGSALDIFGGSLKYSDVVEWHSKEQLVSSGW